MLDRAGGYSNELFRFSTKEKQWEQLNATRVSETRSRRSSARGQSPSLVRGMLRTRTRAAGRRQLGAKRVSGSPPSARSYHGMVSVGSDIYVFGGLTDTEYSYSNDLFRFSTTEQKWEQLNATRVSGPPPSPRSGHGMVAVGSDIHVFGGGMGSGYGSTELFRFSTTEEKWEHLGAQRVSGPPPSQRFGHGMVAVGRDLYVFGGLVASASKARRKGQEGACARVRVPVPVRVRACACA